MRVAQRLGRERGVHLAETDVGFGEWCRAAFRAQENRPDDIGPPPDRDDDDRTDSAIVELLPDAFERRLTGGFGNEHRLPRLERALQLGITAQVDDEVSDI